MNKKPELNGFSPIFNRNSKILILGSFPSVVSRQNNFYYGNLKNRFWTTLNLIFNENANTIDEKIKMLLNHKIALWDIVKSCNNKNSMDSNLKDIKFANVLMILKTAKIEKVLCNGTKSYELTKKYFKENKLALPLIKMPSTSPANTKFNFNEWKHQLN